VMEKIAKIKAICTKLDRLEKGWHMPELSNIINEVKDIKVKEKLETLISRYQECNA